jgi:hypothetical protein
MNEFASSAAISFLFGNPSLLTSSIERVLIYFFPEDPKCCCVSFMLFFNHPVSSYYRVVPCRHCLNWF